MYQCQLFSLFLALLIGSGNVRPALAVVPESEHGLRHVLSLDGQWQIIFDRENTGKSEDLHQRARYLAQPDRVPIPVPAAWEEIEQDYQGVGWYYREFQVPESWTGQVVRLQFGAVNYRAEIWINDVVLGHHEAGYTPFATPPGPIP